MFGHNHYVPILKWKQGEQEALELLEESLHNKFTPLIELPYIETNYKENRLARSIEEHIDRLSTSIKKPKCFSPITITILSNTCE